MQRRSTSTYALDRWPSGISRPSGAIPGCRYPKRRALLSRSRRSKALLHESRSYCRSCGGFQTRLTTFTLSIVTGWHDNSFSSSDRSTVRNCVATHMATLHKLLCLSLSKLRGRTLLLGKFPGLMSPYTDLEAHDHCAYPA